MRWFPYFILAYIALGVQVALSGFVEVKDAAPNFVLLVVIFIGVNAPREPALLGAFVLGVLQDLFTLHPLGSWAACYGLVAMFVLSTQEIVYREHPLTHFSLGLAGGLVCAVFLAVHGWVYPLIHSGAPRVPASPYFISAVYTAVVAPIVLGLLQRVKKGFAFRKRMGVGK